MICRTNAVIGGGPKESEIIKDIADETMLMEGTITKFYNENVKSSNNITAFSDCVSLKEIDLPSLKSIPRLCFTGLTSLETVKLKTCNSIDMRAFADCSSLQSIYLGTSSVFTIGSNVFSGAGITPSTGSIFVRTSLVSTFKSAIGWSYFSNRIFGYNFEYGEEENGAGGGGG